MPASLVRSGVTEPKPSHFLKDTVLILYLTDPSAIRARKNRNLELLSATDLYPSPGHYTVAVKVIDVFGNDTMILVPVGLV